MCARSTFTQNLWKRLISSQLYASIWLMQSNPYIHPSDLPKLGSNLSATSTIQAAERVVEVEAQAPYIYCTCTMKISPRFCGWDVTLNEPICPPLPREPYQIEFKLAKFAFEIYRGQHPILRDVAMYQHVYSAVALALCPHCLTLYWARLACGSQMPNLRA